MSLMGMPALVLGNYQYDVYVHKCSLCVMVENENIILHSSNVSNLVSLLCDGDYHNLAYYVYM